MSKFKLVLTAIVCIVYTIFMNIYNLYESPIRGVANAQQLNNSVHDYALGNFVAHDSVPHIAILVLVLALVIIWVSSIIRLVKVKSK